MPKSEIYQYRECESKDISSGGLCVINQTQIALMTLIKASLSGEKPALPEDTDWNAVLTEARQQTVVGLVAKAVPNTESTALKDDMLSIVVTYTNVLHEQTQLVRLFEDHELPLVILKGTAAAYYYPEPALRTMGDIDFLVPQEQFEDAVRLMEKNGYKPHYEERNAFVIPRHLKFEKNGIEYELHHHYSSYGLDLEPYLIDGLDRAVRRKIGGNDFPTLPNPENALVLLDHVRRHLIECGIGLRQVIDWMECMCSLAQEETASLQCYAKETGLEKLACALNQICCDYFGMPDRLLWKTKIDPKIEDDLLKLLFERGNFGGKMGSPRPAEAVSLSVRTMGLFPYLQCAGMRNWKAAQLHPALRPFAWMHTIGRYAKKGTRLLISPGSLREQFAGSQKIAKLLHELDLG